jgi:hypothetical protein
VYTFFFLALKGQQHTRATPWVKINQSLSPVRAQHKDKLKRTHNALTGLKTFYILPQGVALGWYVAALSGQRKKMYTLIDLSAWFKNKNEIRFPFLLYAPNKEQYTLELHKTYGHFK